MISLFICSLNWVKNSWEDQWIIENLGYRFALSGKNKGIRLNCMILQ